MTLKTIPLSLTNDTQPQPNRPTGLTNARNDERLVVKWAQHLDEVRQAQRLRYQVFAHEMGAALHTPLEGHDVDDFDAHCEHLLVMDGTHSQVIGTYRLLTPTAARRMGRLYSEQEFTFQGIDAHRDRMVELGRSCVHPQHRQGGVIMALWGALARFMQSNQLTTMLGCASIPMWHNGMVSLSHAQSVWQTISPEQRTQSPALATPLLPLPLPSATEATLASPAVEVPALIKGYLRLGAKVMGPPAWDPDFNTADLPMFMNWADLHPRYAKHFSHA
jgi:putative hemolysin